LEIRKEIEGNENNINHYSKPSSDEANESSACFVDCGGVGCAVSRSICGLCLKYYIDYKLTDCWSTPLTEHLSNCKQPIGKPNESACPM
jgi:hypothetical protein